MFSLELQGQGLGEGGELKKTSSVDGPAGVEPSFSHHYRCDLVGGHVADVSACPSPEPLAPRGERPEAGAVGGGVGAASTVLKVF